MATALLAILLRFDSWLEMRSLYFVIAGAWVGFGFDLFSQFHLYPGRFRHGSYGNDYRGDGYSPMVYDRTDAFAWIAFSNLRCCHDC